MRCQTEPDARLGDAIYFSNGGESIHILCSRSFPVFIVITSHDETKRYERARDLAEIGCCGVSFRSTSRTFLLFSNFLASVPLLFALLIRLRSNTRAHPYCVLIRTSDCLLSGNEARLGWFI